MPILKEHGSYIHDFRRFDLVHLCDVTAWDLVTFVRRAELKGFIERNKVDGDGFLINKGWAIIDKLGDRALILYNHDGDYRIKTLAWEGFVDHLVLGGYDLPDVIKNAHSLSEER